MEIDEIIVKVKKIEHGFSPMQKIAGDIVQSNTPKRSYSLARELYKSELRQVRMVTVFILGMIAAENIDAFMFLYHEVKNDPSWQVQEVFAKAFDNFCRDIGYEKALPIIKTWLKDKNANVKRAVSEGLRIWTTRPYFKEHPEIAIKLLSKLKDDESEYVRKSIGNAIRDISRKNPKLVKTNIGKWDLSDKKVLQVYKLARKFL